MSVQRFIEPLLPTVHAADQTAVPGTTEAVLWASYFCALPANFFEVEGKVARITAAGVMTTGGTPGTLTLTPRFGTSTGGTSLGAGAASGTLATSVTGVPWWLTGLLTCRTIGPTGSVYIFGQWWSPRGYATAPGVVELGSGAVTTVDTTSSGGITITATLSQAGSSLTTRAMLIESVN